MSSMLDPYHRWLGISPKDQPPHHYRLLGIDLFEADPEVIRDASDRQMAHVRTYQLGQHAEISQRLLNELATAKGCLLDPPSKAMYDAAIRQRLQPPPLSLERLEPATATTDTRPATAQGTGTATSPPGGHIRAVGTAIVGGLAAAGRRLDGLSRRLVGEENDILRYFLWAALPLLLLVAVGAGFWALTPPPVPFKLRPIEPQTIEVGKPLNVTTTVESRGAGTDLAKQQSPIAGGSPSSGDPTKSDPSKEQTGSRVTTNSASPAPTLPPTSSTPTPKADAKVEPIAEPVSKMEPPAPDRQPEQPRSETTAEIDSKRLANSIGVQFVLIPAGEFLMGSTSEQIETAVQDASDRSAQWTLDRIAAERPQHRVEISQAFYLGTCEVTQAEYAQVMGVNPSANAAEKAAETDTGRYPVETVTWEEAIEFCRKLSALPAEFAARRIYRLPTEAEWEYACRAGTTTQWYCGEDEGDLVEYAWIGNNAGGTPHPVGEKKPNAWGLYDMHGNVWEWCMDCFDPTYYGWSSRVDPQGPGSGSERVLRGGMWTDNRYHCRSAFRSHAAADFRYHGIGFRVVCDLESKRTLGHDTQASTDGVGKAENGLSDAELECLLGNWEVLIGGEYQSTWQFNRDGTVNIVGGLNTGGVGTWKADSNNVLITWGYDQRTRRHPWEGLRRPLRLNGVGVNSWTGRSDMRAVKLGG